MRAGPCSSGAVVKERLNELLSLNQPNGFCLENYIDFGGPGFCTIDKKEGFLV